MDPNDGDSDPVADPPIPLYPPGEDMRLIEVTDSGRFRVGLRRNGMRVVTKSFATVVEARLARDIAEREMTLLVAPGGVTVEQWGRIWISELPQKLRAEEGNEKKINDLPNDRSRLHCHILKMEDLASKPVRLVTEDDIKKFVGWLAKRKTQRLEGKDKSRAKGARRRTREIVQVPLGVQTRRRIITVLREMFQAAVNDDQNRCKCHGRPNPVSVNITIPGGARTTKKVKKDVPLYPEHQVMLLDRMGDMIEKLIVIIAIWTGLRIGELWNLELVDVHLDEPVPGKLGETRSYIHVRYGSRGHLPPKNGKEREVDLMGAGLDAMRRWIANLMEYAPYNPYGLLFPTPRRKGSTGKSLRGGCRRGGRPDWWIKLQNDKVLGEKRFWWHALRHTCAMGLLNGWFNRRWTIIEVAEFLGHSSTEITEMYAHLTQDSMRNIAAETDAAWRAANEPKTEAAAPEPPTPPAAPGPRVERKAAEIGRLTEVDNLRALVLEAAGKGNWALVQALSPHTVDPTAVAPATSPQVIQPAAPSPVSNTLASSPVQPSPRGPARTGHRVRSPRSSGRVANGDTEGPRRTGDQAQQLTSSMIDPTSLGWSPVVSPRAPSTSTGLSPETLTLTLGSQGLYPARPRRSPTEPATTKLQPEPSRASGVDAVVSTRPAAEPPNPIATDLQSRDGIAASRSPLFDRESGSCPRSVQGSGLTERYQVGNSVARRSTEPKVESSNLSGRAEQYQLVSGFSGPTLGQALDKAGVQDLPLGAPADPTATVGLEHTAHEPDWLTALRTVVGAPERPRALATTQAPPSVPIDARAAILTATAPEAQDDPAESPGDTETDTTVTRAQRLLRFVAAGRQDARRVAEDLAMGLLMSSSDKRHHGAARLVLDEPELAIPRALELALRVIGRAPRLKKAKSRKCDAG